MADFLSNLIFRSTGAGAAPLQPRPVSLFEQTPAAPPAQAADLPEPGSAARSDFPSAGIAGERSQGSGQPPFAARSAASAAERSLLARDVPPVVPLPPAAPGTTPAARSLLP